MVEGTPMRSASNFFLAWRWILGYLRISHASRVFITQIWVHSLMLLKEDPNRQPDRLGGCRRRWDGSKSNQMAWCNQNELGTVIRRRFASRFNWVMVYWL
ncbi:hypothetical protein ES332_A12G072400v1 [Gossypium tomentosum]|uniref:Reverse transcriptase zinc-binding domain-containing protein n=1 Tax=Gossypium tomentosum TaxID=34277 RepID=A0A5D2MTW0_GOSTO|nr:hypothetical protein ES332_A12G072400v1 [Gossypium tomentosum]